MAELGSPLLGGPECVCAADDTGHCSREPDQTCLHPTSCVDSRAGRSARREVCLVAHGGSQHRFGSICHGSGHHGKPALRQGKSCFARRRTSGSPLAPSRRGDQIAAGRSTPRPSFHRTFLVRAGVIGTLQTDLSGSWGIVLTTLRPPAALIGARVEESSPLLGRERDAHRVGQRGASVNQGDELHSSRRWSREGDSNS